MEGPVLGIDMAKSTFDVALCQDNNKVKTKKFANNTEGFTALKTWLLAHGIEHVHACMESTGCYGIPLATYLYENHFKVSIVNPARIKGFAMSILTRVKTDKADCQLIAKFCYAMQPEFWQPTLEHIALLQQWLHRLNALIAQKNQERNRLEGVAEVIAQDIQCQIDSLNQRIQTVEGHIKQLIQVHPDLSDKSKLVVSIPGIGEKTAAHLLAFIHMEKFDSAKKAVAFVGLNPKLKQSGSSVNKGSSISKVGSKKLRKAFYMPAVVAMRWNPIVKDLAERLTKAGKPKMVIVIAAMRKLIHIAYGVLKHKTPFTANPI